jgi:hypothetical protein
MTDLTDEILYYLSTDTLKSIQRNLEAEWAIGVKRGCRLSSELCEFMGDVDKAIKERASPISVVSPVRTDVEKGDLIDYEGAEGLTLQPVGSHKTNPFTPKEGQ